MASAVSVPVVSQRPANSHPPLPPGLKETTLQGPDVLQPAAMTPVLQWGEITYWPFSFVDNRESLAIVAYDASGKVLRQWVKDGARYVYKVEVDAGRRTVTFRGQADHSVTAGWDELQVAAPENPQRPRVNAIIATTATIEDSFPDTMALDIGIEGRPYAAIGRRHPDGRPADPDVVVVSGEGVLYRLRPPAEAGGDWGKDTFALPELRGGIVMGISASTQDPYSGDERLIVAITGQTAARDRVFLILQWTPAGKWERFAMPPSPFSAKDLSMAVGSGFAGLGGGKLQTFYACFPPSARLGSLAAYGVSNSGKAFTVAFLDNPRGIDRLIATEAGGLALARLENDVLTLYPGRLDGYPEQGIMPARFDLHDRRLSMAMPQPVGAQDARCMVPIMDTLGGCRGMFVTTAGHGAIACAFGERGLSGGMLTGRAGGPADAIDIASSLDDHGNTHIFLSDSAHLLWYACWPKGGAVDGLAWEQSGQLVENIDAPSLVAGAPTVFSGNANGAIVQFGRAAPGREWARCAIDIPDPVPEPIAATIHVVTISTVTAQSAAVAGTPVRIRASEPVVAEHGGRLYRLGPDRHLDLATGRTGSVMLRLRANGISSAELLVSSSALPSVPEQAYRPQDAALARLTGQDPKFPVTGASIRAAGLVPADVTAEDADKIAAAIRQSAQAALGGSTAAPAGPHRRALAFSADAAAPVSIRISRTESGLQVEQTVPGALRRSLTSAQAVEQADSGGGFWSFLRTAWNTIKSFAIEVVQGVVKFVVETAHKVKEWVTEAVNSIARGIESLVSWLKQMASDAVDAARKLGTWLAEKLGWGDVIRCKRVVRDYALASMIDLETLVGRTIPAKVSEGIAYAKSKMEEAFDRARGHLAGFGDSARQQVLADPGRGSFSRNSSSLMLFQNALPEDDGSHQVLAISDSLKAKFQQLASRVQEIGDQTRLGNLLEPLARFFDGKTSLEQALALGLGDLLGILKPLVLFGLDLLDTLQTLLFEIVAAVIGLIRQAMATPITALGSGFRWVNGLYRTVSGGDDLTFIDLACLLFVAPGVILQHIVAGKPVLAENVTVPVPTGALAFANAALAPTPDPVAAKATANAALDFAKTYVQPIIRIAGGAWALIRSLSVLYEDGNRVANLENVDLPGASIWSVICSIVDYVLLLPASMAIPVLEAFWSLPELAQSLTLLAIFAVGMVAAFVINLVALCWEQITAAIAAIPKAVKVIVSSFFTLVVGVFKLLFQLGYGLYWWIAQMPHATANATLRFNVGIAGKILDAARSISSPMLPVGYGLAKTGGGPVAIVGAVLLAGSFVIDPVTYLAGGATALFVGIHELAAGA